MGKVALLMEKLKDKPYGDGHLLDHAAMLVTTEISDGNLHDFVNIPCFVAGKAGGRLKGDRLLAYNNESYNKLLVSICHAAGSKVETFGNAEYGTGPLSNILV